MEKSFEEALSELEAIVKELESGNVNLDDAINKYGEAMKLVKVCEDKIKNAEDMVVKIVKDNKVEDFEVQNESNE
ncbi:MAG: exodeoxyribonuclease VII small subunit [Tenericutes bacterium]|nr:exodeoxyribonuclease VII small subunit [Mycoplasmatota bacterium]MDO4377479.1 exodeoxyribonuclease VII small subunit [bacterium]